MRVLFFLAVDINKGHTFTYQHKKRSCFKNDAFQNTPFSKLFQKAPFSWAFLDPFCLDVRQKRIKRMCFETKSPRCRWDPQLFRCDFEWSQYCVFIWKQTILMHFLQPSTKENWENVKLINRLLKNPTTWSRGDWNKF